MSAVDTLTDAALKTRLQQILAGGRLQCERETVRAVVAELGVDALDCAAALLSLLQSRQPSAQPPAVSTGIKMVRYRLDVGSRHKVTLEELKKVLVEESGVDKNNINNVDIRDAYTLMELPDAMPPDIFQHLKTFEINDRKLDIKRVKPRNNKKRGFTYHRRGRQRNIKPGPEATEQANG